MTPERWRQVEEIYQSVMDREPETRAAWLEEACHGDEELRREVESLVKLTSTPVLLDQPAWQVAGELLDNDSSMAVGAQLGPYRIEGVLGAGGMGQVYRARDTRLDRAVAVKVSREEFEERFAREARAIAALNHPNICTLHDVGPNYLVMELVEGPTLGERIRQGPMPIEEALGIARQIAEALDAAHEAGIVHRDLKPGNIKIKPDGTVKVLDFGLAKRRPADSGPAKDPRESPTISMAATRDGMLLGTAAYMSPEQARGQEVDKRSDIWSFGVVLYEMLTGLQLFEAPTVTDTLAAVLTKEPDWSKLPAKALPLLRRCLEKDPKRRLRDIGDAFLLLNEGSQPRAAIRSRLPLAIAAVAVLLAVGTLAWRGGRPVEKPLVRLEVNLGSEVTLGGRNPGSDVILSPDGTRIAFLSAGKILTRRLDQQNNTELAGTEEAAAPFFSPDGRWIGFFARSKLMKISVEGGSPTALCDVDGSGSASWSEDGSIIANLGIKTPLSRIPENGGTPTPVTTLDRERKEVTHRWPQVLPGGKAVLFTAHTSQIVGFSSANLDVVTLQDHNIKTLLRGAGFGRYLSSGHLVYVNRGVLFAVAFNPDRLELQGTPTAILEPVAYSSMGGQAQFDCSRSGTAVYRAGGTGEGFATVHWLDGTGRDIPLITKAGEYRYPRLSPDGRRLILTVTEGTDQDIWIYDLERGTRERLTNGGVNTAPTWSPDGKYVVFAALGGLFWTKAQSTHSAPQRFAESTLPRHVWSFAPDGRALAFQQGFGGEQYDIGLLTVANDGAGLQAGPAKMVIQSRFSERAPALSPDGRWLAYQSNESGRDQVYVCALPCSGEKWQVSIDGGQIATWSPAAHELFFRDEDAGRIMVARYTAAGSSFRSEKPRIWLARRLANPRGGRNFDIAPDGKRLIGLIPTDQHDDQASRNHVILLENFFDELRRRVPVGR